MIKSMSRQARYLYVAFILFALVLSIIYVLIAGRFYSHNMQNIVLQNAVAKSNERAALVKDYLKKAELNITYLRRSDAFLKYLNDQTDKSEITALFSAYAKYDHEIMQLRFIDANGFEKVRVERDAPKADIYITNDQDLQNKSGRYYFSGSLPRETEKVWYTQIDLNIENGVVVEPHMFTLRTILPVSHKGRFSGILIINQFANDFIKRLVDTPLYDSIVFNDAGNIIYHYENGVHLGEYPVKPITIQEYFPSEYRKILNKDLYKTDLFVSKKLNVPVSGGLGIMLQLKKQYIDVQKAHARDQYIIISIAIFLFSTVFAYFIVNKFSHILLNLKELQRLNDRVKNASVVAKIGFWEAHPDGSVSWSDGAYDVFEIDDKNRTMTVDSFLTYLSKEDGDKLMEIYTASIANKQDHFYDHAITTEKGNIKYVEERAKHHYDSAGNYMGSTGSMYDITERYLASQRYKLLLELASDGIFIIDYEGRLVEFSNVVSKMLGYSAEELRGLTVFDWDKELSSGELDSMLGLLTAGHVIIERVHTRKDGSVYNAQITSRKIMLNGKPYIYSSVRDVTQQKEIEEKIIRQRDELEAIFDTALEGIAIIDLNGVCIKINKKYSEILGYKVEELVNKSIFSLANLTYIEKAKEIFREVIKTGSYENFERNYPDPKGNIKRLTSSLVLMPNRKEILVTTVEYTELYNAYKLIEEQALTDELTKLYNRKAFNLRLAEMLAEFDRYGKSFSVVMLDIDHFKSINDTYGHDVGDVVLSRLGQMLKSSARANDYAFRLGGEEFLIILSNTNGEDAVIFADKLRAKIENDLDPIEDRVITSSFGVAEIRSGDTVLSIYKRADNNLYKAKQNERNRVETD